MAPDIFYPNDEKYFREIFFLDFEIYPTDMLNLYKKSIKTINNYFGTLIFSLDYDPKFNVAK